VTGAGPWLAVLLAVAGSAAFAVAAVTQQRAAARLAVGRAFDPAVLARLARRPAWLAGLAAVIAGFGLQAAALGLGRLVVIEPVLASGLLFALVLAARRERRALSRAEWVAALAVVDGLITNDKFCCVRRLRLSLSWWHRPLRLRGSVLQSDVALVGVPDEPVVDRLPPARSAPRRRAPVGSGLPAVSALGGAGRFAGPGADRRGGA
jgi:hypothetical protein